MGEGPEVDAAVVLAKAREGEARDGVVEVDLEEEEPLVVAEVDVEPGLEFLDELALEQQRLGLAADDMTIHVVDGLHERVELGIPAHPPGRVEVLRHAASQVAGLSHVDDGAEAVLVEVHAGPVGDLGELVADVVADGHAAMGWATEAKRPRGRCPEASLATRPAGR